MATLPRWGSRVRIPSSAPGQRRFPSDDPFVAPDASNPPSTTRLVPTAVQDTQQISDTCLQIGSETLRLERPTPRCSCMMTREKEESADTTVLATG